jgi:alpha-ribazole phosphatase
VLYLIRHPRPDIAPGICYGQQNVSVSSAEIHGALARLAPALEDLFAATDTCHIISSPLQRCRTLADALVTQMRWPAPLVEVRLREINFGNWEGQAWNDIPRHEIDAWTADVAAYVPPGGESVLQLRERVLSWLHEIEDSTIPWIVVTHAGVIRVLLGILNNLPFDEWSRLPIDFASLTIASLPRKIPAYV